MQNKMKLGIIAYFLSFAVLADVQEPMSITLATTNWCPYTCGRVKQDHGVIGSYLKAILAQANVTLKVESFPWSRAVLLAQKGMVDGLLTATHSEAPGLLFTTSPISSYQMCFFKNKGDDWNLEMPISLGANKLAVIQDYGYGEPLDSFIKGNNRIVQLSDNNSTPRLLDMLLKKRVNLIVEDEAVLKWNADNNQSDISNLSKAGCLSKNPFYLALYDSKQNRQLINFMNTALALPENLALLMNLMKTYRLESR